MSPTIRARLAGALFGLALITGVWLPARLPRVQAVACYTGIHATPPSPMALSRLSGLFRRVYRGAYFEELVSWGADNAVFANAKSLPIPGQQDHFSVRWNGYLRVPVAGDYGLKSFQHSGIRSLEFT